MTDVALRDYLERRVEDLDRRIDQRLQDLERRHDQRFQATEAAGLKADAELREYKAGANEWRDALKDANNRMATRLEVEKIEKDVQDLREAKANLEGRLVIVSGLISIGVTIVVWAVSQLLGH